VTVCFFQSQPDVLDLDACIYYYRLATGVTPGLEVKYEICISSGYGCADIDFPDQLHRDAVPANQHRPLGQTLPGVAVLCQLCTKSLNGKVSRCNGRDEIR
jgi:hypothetical protein